MKRGRPPVPKEKKKSIVLRFRLSKAEYRALCKAAKRLNLPVSEYVRRLCERENK